MEFTNYLHHHLISSNVTGIRPHLMEELLQRLERQVKKLIDQHNQLKNSQQQLHQGRFVLMREKELLLSRQKKAIVQIETLISKLKAIEKLP